MATFEDNNFNCKTAENVKEPKNSMKQVMDTSLKWIVKKSSRNKNMLNPKNRRFVHWSWGWELNPPDLAIQLLVFACGDIGVIVSSQLPSLFCFL